MKKEINDLKKQLGNVARPISFAAKNGVKKAANALNKAADELERINIQKQKKEIEDTIDAALGEALDKLDEEDFLGVQAALLELKPQLREKAGLFLEGFEGDWQKKKDTIVASAKKAMKDVTGELKEAVDYAAETFPKASGETINDAIEWFKSVIGQDISDAIADYYEDMEDACTMEELLETLSAIFSTIAESIHDTIADYKSEVDEDEDEDEAGAGAGEDNEDETEDGKDDGAGEDKSNEPGNNEKIAGYVVIVSYSYTPEKEAYFAQTMKDAIEFMETDYLREKAQDEENGKEIEEAYYTLTGAKLKIKSADDNNITYWDIVPAANVKK